MSNSPDRRETTRKRPRPSIIHCDPHLLVIDKPAGVLSVPGRGGQPSIAELMRGHEGLPETEPFHTVHRLDQDASGVIIFARTLEAQRILTKAFGDRRVEKVYLVLVQGYVKGDGEIDLPLRTDEEGTRAAVAKRDGKASVTRYGISERFPGHTLLECRPLTGRLHQIRVHLAAVGHPLAVDPIYGGSSALYLSTFKSGYKPSRIGDERPLIDRLTLHAAKITLDHPDGTGPVTFESPLPKDFRATLTQLRRAGSAAKAQK